MDTSPEPPSSLPAVRLPARPPGKPGPDQPVSDQAGADVPASGGSRPPHRWRRLSRSRRGAAGIGIATAALLLWPFSGWSALPWLAGLGAVALLRAFRLDGLLRGWAPHLGGLVVVAGLMLSTDPWAWALAASIGVLLAGLVQLPGWRLAAVGAVLCLVTGAGYAWSNVRDAEQVAAEQAQTQLQNRGRLGAARPNGVLPALLNRIAAGSPGAVCDNLLAEPARVTFVAAAGAADCATAVRALAAQVLDRNSYADADAEATRAGDVLTVDACALTWDGAPAGPQLGELTVGRIGQTYVVTRFRPC